MVKVIKTDQGCYLATLTGNIVVLGRKESHRIKHELSAILKPGREITLDLEGVKNIDIASYKILRELKQHIDSRKCLLKFINIDDTLTKKIEGISGKKFLVYD